MTTCAKSRYIRSISVTAAAVEQTRPNIAAAEQRIVLEHARGSALPGRGLPIAPFVARPVAHGPRSPNGLDESVAAAARPVIG